MEMDHIDYYKKIRPKIEEEKKYNDRALIFFAIIAILAIFSNLVSPQFFTNANFTALFIVFLFGSLILTLYYAGKKTQNEATIKEKLFYSLYNMTRALEKYNYDLDDKELIKILKTERAVLSSISKIAITDFGFPESTLMNEIQINLIKLCKKISKAISTRNQEDALEIHGIFINLIDDIYKNNLEKASKILKHVQFTEKPSLISKIKNKVSSDSIDLLISFIITTILIGSIAYFMKLTLPSTLDGVLTCLTAFIFIIGSFKIGVLPKIKKLKI